MGMGCGALCVWPLHLASLLAVVTVRIALAILSLLVLLVLPLLLTDSYREASWPLMHGAAFAFLSQLSSIGERPHAKAMRTTARTSLHPSAASVGDMPLFLPTADRASSAAAVAVKVALTTTIPGQSPQQWGWLRVGQLGKGQDTGKYNL